MTTRFNHTHTDLGAHYDTKHLHILQTIEIERATNSSGGGGDRSATGCRIAHSDDECSHKWVIWKDENLLFNE